MMHEDKPLAANPEDRLGATGPDNDSGKKVETAPSHPHPGERPPGTALLKQQDPEKGRNTVKPSTIFYGVIAAAIFFFPGNLGILAAVAVPFDGLGLGDAAGTMMMAAPFIIFCTFIMGIIALETYRCSDASVSKLHLAILFPIAIIAVSAWLS